MNQEVYLIGDTVFNSREIAIRSIRLTYSKLPNQEQTIARAMELIKVRIVHSTPQQL